MRYNGMRLCLENMAYKDKYILNELATRENTTPEDILMQALEEMAERYGVKLDQVPTTHPIEKLTDMVKSYRIDLDELESYLITSKYITPEQSFIELDENIAQTMVDNPQATIMELWHYKKKCLTTK